MFDTRSMGWEEGALSRVRAGAGTSNPQGAREGSDENPAAVWVALLVAMLLAAAGAHAQTIEPVDALIVVDTNGKKVGNALSPPFSESEVSFRVNGRVFFLRLDTNGFETGFDAYYEAADCTGTPYTFLEQLADRSQVRPPGKTLYLPNHTAQPRTIALGSHQTFSLQNNPACAPFSTNLGNMVPLVPVVDLNTMFTPPFHLVPAASTGATACCGDCNADGKVTIDELVTAVNFGLNDCPK